MKKVSLINRFALAVACATLVWATTPLCRANAVPGSVAIFRSTIGANFTNLPTADPLVLSHTVDGAAQVNEVGNCAYHAVGQIHLPAAAGQPITLVASGTFTSSDGLSTLQFTFQGTAVFDPVNPLFANVTGIATFTGGSGAFASATGKAWVSVTAVANSPTTGVAAESWTGYVITPP